MEFGTPRRCCVCSDHHMFHKGLIVKMEPISNCRTSGHTQKYDPGCQRKDECLELAVTTRIKALRQSKHTRMAHCFIRQCRNLGGKAGIVRKGGRLGASAQ